MIRCEELEVEASRFHSFHVQYIKEAEYLLQEMKKDGDVHSERYHANRIQRKRALKYANDFLGSENMVKRQIENIKKGFEVSDDVLFNSSDYEFIEYELNEDLS